MSRIASRLSGICLLAIVLLAASLRAAVAEEPSPTPYTPNPEYVYLQHEDHSYHINVTITFPCLGMRVSWGKVEVLDNEAWANAEMWYPPVIIWCFETVTHLYYLGKLQPGDYTFTFKVWDTPIREITFTYTCRPIDLNGDGIVDLYDLCTVCKAYGCHLGEPGYNPDADFNMDDLVDIRDVTLVCRCWGDP